MKTKPITPYQRLLSKAVEFAHSVKCRHSKLMCRFPKEKLLEGWRLDETAERVAAAEQLGYEVHLRSTDAGLEVWYVKKAPETPWDWQA